MKFWVIGCITILFVLGAADDDKGSEEKTTADGKNDHFMPKSENEKEVLKLVADRIYGILNKIKTGDRTIRGKENLDTGKDFLGSVLSMVLDREGRDPHIETDAHVLETLTHIIAEETEKLRKRKDNTDFSNIMPNIPTKLIEGMPKNIHAQMKLDDKRLTSQPMSKFGVDAKITTLAKVPNLLGKNNFESKLLPEIKLPEVGKDKILDKVHADSKSVGERELSANRNPLKAMLPADMDKIEADPDESTVKLARDPVLKLTPHVVFTDSDGREYRLVGVGSRSSLGCTGQCLSVDQHSRDVLAFRKPAAAEYLVLADHFGDEYYTSGVQLCEDTDSKKVSNVRSANLGFFVPGPKRNSDLSITWHDEAKITNKREDQHSRDEFSEDAKKLFNGFGLKSEVDKKALKMSPDQLMDHFYIKNKAKRKKRQKHVRLLRKKRNKKKKKEEEEMEELHTRKEREASSAAYFESEPLMDELDRSEASLNDERTPFELKLLEGLKKDKSKLMEFSHRARAQVDVDKCKRHCETLASQLKRFAEESHDNDHRSIRTKRSLESPVEDDLGSKFMNQEFLSSNPVEADPEDFHIVAIEPQEVVTVQGPDEEINMIQPSTAPDEENRLLLNNPSVNAKEILSDEKLQAIIKKFQPKHSKPFSFYGGHKKSPTRHDAEQIVDIPGLKNSKLEPKVEHYELPLTNSLPELVPPVSLPSELDSMNGGLQIDLGSKGDQNWGAIHKIKEPVETVSAPAKKPVLEKEDALTMGEVGRQFAEAVLFNVRNTINLKEVLGSALKLTPMQYFPNSPGIDESKFESSVQSILKRVMVGIEKIAEEDVAKRSCIKLEEDLIKFLSALMQVPYTPSATTDVTVNLTPQRSYKSFSSPRNSLVGFLNDFHEEANKVNPERLLRRRRNPNRRTGFESLRSRRENQWLKKSATDKLKKLVDNWNPFHGMDFSHMNPFLVAKPIAETQPYPEYVSEIPRKSLTYTITG